MNRVCCLRVPVHEPESAYHLRLLFCVFKWTRVVILANPGQPISTRIENVGQGDALKPSLFWRECGIHSKQNGGKHCSWWCWKRKSWFRRPGSWKGSPGLARCERLIRLSCKCVKEFVRRQVDPGWRPNPGWEPTRARFPVSVETWVEVWKNNKWRWEHKLIWRVHNSVRTCKKLLPYCTGWRIWWREFFSLIPSS